MVMPFRQGLGREQGCIAAERLELQCIAGWVQEEQRRLFARL